MSRMSELGDLPLQSSKDLSAYLEKVKKMEQELYTELAFGAEVLQRNLATVPPIDKNGTAGAGRFPKAKARMQARKVARYLRRASESHKYAGGQAVACWREFVRSYAPSQNHVGGDSPRRGWGAGADRRKSFDV